VSGLDEHLWVLADVAAEGGPEALRFQIADIDDRQELERLLALAVEAWLHAEGRADAEIARFQRRLAKGKPSS
jgi:hypothetical protein